MCWGEPVKVKSFISLILEIIEKLRLEGTKVLDRYLVDFNALTVSFLAMRADLPQRPTRPTPLLLVLFEQDPNFV